MDKRLIRYLEPTIEDGASIWRLVRDCGRLDLNSAYSYLMLCEWFTDTCVTAKSGDELAGFVSGCRLPNEPDTLFVWQVVVAGPYLGQGIGLSLIQELLSRRSNRHIRYIIATISPNNEASIRLFTKLAKQVGAELNISEKFSSQLFPQPEGTHEAEFLYRIGPIKIRD